MIPVPQRICATGTPGDSNNPPGDCFKCCVASILELPYDDVPHFVNREVVDPNLVDGVPHPDGPFKLDWLRGVNFWLRQRGYPLRVEHIYHCLGADEMREFRTKLGLEPGQMSPNPHTDHLRRRAFPDDHSGWWIASVISENFEDSTHAVVMFDDRVMFDPSPHARRTPYEFVGGKVFVSTNAAVFTRKPDETGWLIETKDGPAMWWSATAQCGRVWTTDASKAIRFARKVDAETVIRALWSDSLAMRTAIATEHMWCPPVPQAAVNGNPG